MIELTPSRDGVLVNVHAQPGARRNAVIGEREGAVRVAVTAPPDKGKANAAILDVLAEALGLRPSQLLLVSGETSRRKRILLTGIAPDDARSRIDRALPDIQAPEEDPR